MHDDKPIDLPVRKPQPLVDLAVLRQEDKGAFAKDEFSVLYPQYDDFRKKRKARELFFRDNQKLEDISRIVEAPLNTVLAWAYVEKWVARKAEEVKVLQAEERMHLARLRLERRTNIVKDQLDASKKIRGKADDLVEDAATSSQLKLAAEAVKLATDIETRALGIADDGKISSADGEEKEGKEGGKQPLVMVFGGTTGLPPVRISKPIVIDEEGNTVD